MSLEYSLIKDFVNASKNDDTERKVTYYATAHIKVDESTNHRYVYVQIDGSSERYTPVDTGIDAKEGDRVTVQIVDNKVIITSNITDPEAGQIAKEMSPDQRARYDALTADITFTGKLNASKADIDLANIDTANINKVKANDIVAKSAEVEKGVIHHLEADKISTDDIEADTGRFNYLKAIEIGEVKKINGLNIGNGTVVAKALSQEAVITTGGAKLYYGSIDVMKTKYDIGEYTYINDEGVEVTVWMDAENHVLRDGIDTWYKTVMEVGDPESHAMYIWSDEAIPYEEGADPIYAHWKASNVDGKIIREESITAAEIASNAITSNKIAANTIEVGHFNESLQWSSYNLLENSNTLLGKDIVNLYSDYFISHNPTEVWDDNYLELTPATYSASNLTVTVDSTQQITFDGGTDVTAQNIDMQSPITLAAGTYYIKSVNDYIGIIPEYVVPTGMGVIHVEPILSNRLGTFTILEKHANLPLSFRYHIPAIKTFTNKTGYLVIDKKEYRISDHSYPYRHTKKGYIYNTTIRTSEPVPLKATNNLGKDALIYIYKKNLFDFFRDSETTSVTQDGITITKEENGTYSITGSPTVNEVTILSPVFDMCWKDHYRMHVHGVSEEHSHGLYMKVQIRMYGNVDIFSPLNIPLSGGSILVSGTSDTVTGVQFAFVFNGTSSVFNENISIQLEKGNVPTEFEPCSIQKYTIPNGATDSTVGMLYDGVNNITSPTSVNSYLAINNFTLDFKYRVRDD